MDAGDKFFLEIMRTLQSEDILSQFILIGGGVKNYTGDISIIRRNFPHCVQLILIFLYVMLRKSGNR